MKITSLVAAAILWTGVSLASVQAGSVAEPFDDSRIAPVEYPSWFKDSFLDLPEDLAEAEASGKKGIMIVFGTQGCSYCKVLIDRVLSDPELRVRIQRHFDAIGLEIFSDAEMTDPKGAPMRVKDFARQEKAEFSPTLAFYGLNGDRIFRVVGYYPRKRFRLVLEYLTGEHYRTGSFSAFLAGTEQSSLPRGPSADVASEPGRMLERDAAPAPRPLLVVFEKTDCPACRHFSHDVLTNARVLALLNKFRVLRLDVESTDPLVTPGGRHTNAAEWSDSLGFTRTPALAFFNEQGKAVLKTDAQVGRQRMENALGYALDRAYEQGISYQRYARNRALEKTAR